MVHVFLRVGPWGRSISSCSMCVEFKNSCRIMCSLLCLISEMDILFVSTCCVSKKGRLKKDVLAWYISLGLAGNHSYRHHMPRTGPL